MWCVCLWQVMLGDLPNDFLWTGRSQEIIKKNMLMCLWQVMLGDLPNDFMWTGRSQEIYTLKKTCGVCVCGR